VTTISHAELADRMEEIAGELHESDSDTGFLRNAAFMLRAQRREIDRLRGVLETRGLADAYRDGFAAAVDVVRSVEIHVTTGDMGGGWIEPTKSAIMGPLEKSLQALNP